MKGIILLVIGLLIGGMWVQYRITGTILGRPDYTGDKKLYIAYELSDLPTRTQKIVSIHMTDDFNYWVEKSTVDRIFCK